MTPGFQVITTWIWNGVGAFVVMGIVAALLPVNIATDREALKARPDLALIPIITEIVAAGLLPIVFTLINKDSEGRA